MLLLAPLAPRPSSLPELRLAAYLPSVAFFAVVGAFVIAVLALDVRSGRLIGTLVAVLAVLVIALNVLSIPVASDLAKIALGTLAGLGMARLLERPWWLLPVCLCVPAADAWSVFSSRGVTHAVVERAQQDRSWLDWPTIATPIAGFEYAAFARIGIVDVLFLALFLAAAWRWDLGVVRCAVVLPLAFVVASVLVLEDVARAVPALPVLCLGFLAIAIVPMWRDLRADLATR